MRLASVALALLLTGCINDAYQPLGGADPAPADVEVKPGELADRSTPGQVKGIVTSLALEPLSGANVTLLSLNRTALTGADGGYLFKDLPNGRALVHASNAGYFSKTQSATIRNGTIVTLDFRLEPVPLVEPYHESVEFAGLVACDAVVQDGTSETAHHCGAADPNDKRVFETDIKAGAETLVVEIRWEAGTPAARHLRAIVETVGFGAADAVLANTTGPSVLRLEVPPSSLAKYYPGGGPVRIVVGPGVSLADEESTINAGLAAQQQFTVFLTAFYHAPAPTSWSVLEGA